jgi:prolyl-tRNA synthetase
VVVGLRVLNHIETIIREEMDRIGGQEILMPALQPREIWDRTGRWDKVDVLFKLKGAGDRDLALGPTHEEAVTPLVTSFIRSYRDLPKVVYQIQTKFRDEPRAKSGLLRGREFRMKDMYSFHADEASLDEFYQKAIAAYQNIYRRCGIGSRTLLTYASGGTFSKYSHEFQTVTPYGEDVIYRIGGSDTAINKEIIGDESVLAELMPGYKVGDEAGLEELKAIEVGNIFKLGSRFTDAFSAQYTDSAGTQQKIVMGCYGLGPSRLMGTIAECLADEKGLVWPQEISPYRLHLVSLVREPGEIEQCNRIYDGLAAQGIEVLYDDRQGPQAGEKLADADLIGIADRIVVSRKTMAAGGVEWKTRLSNESAVITLEKLHEVLRPKVDIRDTATS